MVAVSGNPEFYPVKCKIFVKITPLVKNTRGEKVRILSEQVEFDYVNQNELCNCIPMWKSPVEKPVDSVEKFRVSTGIQGSMKNLTAIFCG